MYCQVRHTLTHCRARARLTCVNRLVVWSTALGNTHIHCGTEQPGSDRHHNHNQVLRNKISFLGPHLRASQCGTRSFIGAFQRQKSMDCRKFHEDARRLFDAAVSSVSSAEMVSKALKVSNGNELTLGDKTYQLNHNVYIIGFGKAVAGMARAVEDVLGEHVVTGVISIPKGSQEVLTKNGKLDLLLQPESRVTVFEGAANNLPDEDSHNAAKAIKKLAEDVGENDILIVLISGGGSALLPLPRPPISLQDEYQLTLLLSRNGATIQQLNTIRQNIEILKGGGLARIAKPAQVISLILSDVIDDKLDVISSGPTVPILTSPRQCIEMMQRLNVYDKVSPAVHQALMEKVIQRKETQSTPPGSKSLDAEYNHVQNVIIGSNTIATQAVCDEASTLGYIPFVLTNSLAGEATEAAKMFLLLAKYITLGFGQRPPDQGNIPLRATEVQLCSSGISKDVLKKVARIVDSAYNSGKGLCIVSGGETVVNVKGDGRGGRNQEMALAFAMELDKVIKKHALFSKTHIEFLSGGTDGQDGPTDAAGAVVNKEFVPLVVSQGMDPEKYLRDNDSYTLFKNTADGMNLIQTGLTGTNVMDIQILLVKLML